MRHVLMTRFAIPFTKNDDHHDQGRKWLDDRFALFEKYTLPSVEAQTCKDFSWVLLVNMEFPHFTHTDADRLTGYGHKVWFVDTVWDREKVGSEFDYGDMLRAHFEENWFITSRLDSDDMLGPHYIEGIQSMFTEERQWIGFDNGLVYHAASGVWFTRKYKNSPFVSLVESYDTIKGVYQFPHTAATKKYSYVSVDDKTPGWVQVIHDSNIKNTAKRI